MRLLLLILSLLFLTGCLKQSVPEPAVIQLTSPAFSAGEMIPLQYTCGGEDINPPLQFTGIPAAAQSLALIVEDPDAPAGTWDHWLVYNLPASSQQIEANSVPPQALQGINSWGKAAWGGPCPPPASTHRYVFKLYALDIKLVLPSGVTKERLQTAMQDHLVGYGELIGRYQR